MQLVFLEKKYIQGGAVEFSFTFDGALSWKPGQYLHIKLPHPKPDDRGEERWFTISSIPSEKRVCIATRIDNEHGSTFKQAMMKLKTGDSVEVSKPEGKFTIDDTHQDYVFVVGGIGITPIRSIMAGLDHSNKAIRAELLYANRDNDTVAFRDELEEFSKKNPSFHITYFYGQNHIDKNSLELVSSKLDSPIYYVSGPVSMVDAIKEILIEMGVDEVRIKLDHFPGYRAV